MWIAFNLPHLTLCIFKKIPFAWIGIFYATFMHLMHSTCTIVCVTHAYHAFRTIFWQILHRSRVIKYRWYRVIIVSNPKISCNIVWIHKKDIAEGWCWYCFKNQTATHLSISNFELSKHICSKSAGDYNADDETNILQLPLRSKDSCHAMDIIQG